MPNTRKLLSLVCACQDGVIHVRHLSCYRLPQIRGNYEPCENKYYVESIKKVQFQTELANSELTDGVNTHATPDGVATLNAVTKSDHGLKYPAHSVQVFLSTP